MSDFLGEKWTFVSVLTSLSDALGVHQGDTVQTEEIIKS